MGLKYPIELEHYPESGRFLAQVKDIPSAFTEGDNREEAFELALSVLLDMLELNYFEHDRPVPLPSFFEGEDYVEVPEDVTQKIMEFNSRLEKLDS